MMMMMMITEHQHSRAGWIRLSLMTSVEKCRRWPSPSHSDLDSRSRWTLAGTLTARHVLEMTFGCCCWWSHWSSEPGQLPLYSPGDATDSRPLIINPRLSSSSSDVLILKITWFCPGDSRLLTRGRLSGDVTQFSMASSLPGRCLPKFPTSTSIVLV